MQPYQCRFCGAPSWVHPSDQTAPPDYCHESDHGVPQCETCGDPIDGATVVSGEKHYHPVCLFGEFEDDGFGS